MATMSIKEEITYTDYPMMKGLQIPNQTKQHYFQKMSFYR